MHKQLAKAVGDTQEFSRFPTEQPRTMIGTEIACKKNSSRRLSVVSEISFDAYDMLDIAGDGGRGDLGKFCNTNGDFKYADTEDDRDALDPEQVIVLKMKVAELLTELEHQQSRANKDEVLLSKLQQRNDALEQENAALRMDNHANEALKTKLVEEMSKLEKESDEMATNQLMLERENNRIKESLKRKEMMISSLEHENQAARKMNVVLEEKISSLEEESDQMASQLLRMKRENERLSGRASLQVHGTHEDNVKLPNHDKPKMPKKIEGQEQRASQEIRHTIKESSWMGVLRRSFQPKQEPTKHNRRASDFMEEKKIDKRRLIPTRSSCPNIDATNIRTISSMNKPDSSDGDASNEQHNDVERGPRDELEKEIEEIDKAQDNLFSMSDPIVTRNFQSSTEAIPNKPVLQRSETLPSTSSLDILDEEVNESGKSKPSTDDVSEDGLSISESLSDHILGLYSSQQNVLESSQQFIVGS